MMKGAIQAANQGQKEKIIHLRQNHSIVMKSSNRTRVQKEKEGMEKQKKPNAGGALKIGDCMDVDLALDINTTIE